MKLRLLVLAAAAAAAVFIVAAPAAAATNVAGNIVTDTVWDLAGSPYIVTSTVTVRGTDGADGVTTLTIDPGVEVRFNQYQALYVGTNSASVPGALEARGTAAQPIVFTSNQGGTQTRGYWGPLQVQNYASDALTTFENVTIEYGGRSTAGMYVYYAQPHLHDVTFRKNSNDGLFVNGLPVTVGAAVFDDNQHYGMYLQVDGSTVTDAAFTGNDVAAAFMYAETTLQGATATGNANQYVYVQGSDVNTDRTWGFVSDGQGGQAYYRVASDFTVRDQHGPDGVTTLTIEPGVEVRFDRYRSIYVGTDSANAQGGALVAVGTPDDPVRFTGSSATKGWWGRLEFRDYATTGASSLQHATFTSGGYGSSGAVYVYRSTHTFTDLAFDANGRHALRVHDGDVTVERATFTGNGDGNGYAVWESGANGQLTLRDVTVTGTVGRPLHMYPWAVLDNVVLASSTQPQVAVPGSTLRTDNAWPALAEPYWIYNDVSVWGQDGADGVTTLTIEPGTTVTFARYRTLFIGSNSGSQLGGALVADGTAAARVTFTSDQEPGAESRGWWGRVEFRDRATDGASSIKNATFSFGGYGSAGSLYAYRSAIVAQDVVIQDSSVYAVRSHQGDVTLQRGTILRSGNSNTGALYMSSADAQLALIDVSIEDSVGSAGQVYPRVRFERVTASGSARPFMEFYGATLTKDATWPDLGEPYRITSDITVWGADGADGVTTLTIEPGTTVTFSRYRSLFIGTNSGSQVGGALDASGTAATPVTFTSDQSVPTPGWWGRVQFQDRATDGASALDHAVFEFGGYGNAGALYVYRSTHTFSDIIVQDSNQYGVRSHEGTLTLERATIRRCGGGGYAVYQSSAAGSLTLHDTAIEDSAGGPAYVYPATSFSGTTAVSGSATPGVVVLGGTMTADTTWRPIGEAFVIAGDITVQGTDGPDGVTTFTLEPGTTMNFQRYRSLYVGSNSGWTPEPGALVAVGTPAEPVTFTSDQAPGAKTPGWWGRVQFQDYAAASGSRLEHAVIAYGGYGNTGGLYVYRADGELAVVDTTVTKNTRYGAQVSDSAVAFTGVTFDDNGDGTGFGLYATGASARVALEDVTFQDHPGRALRVYPNTDFNGVTLTGNGKPGAEIWGATLTTDASWTPLGEPYVLVGDLIIEGADGADGVTTLTLAPGTDVAVSRYYGIYVGASSSWTPNPGALVAVGTPSEPITFRGDGVGDPAPANWWRGIHVRPFATPDASAFAHVSITSAGYGSQGGLYVDRARAAVADVTVRASGTYGVRVNGPLDGQTMTGLDVDDAAYGVYAVSLDGFTLSGSDVTGTTHTVYASDVDGSTFMTNRFTSASGTFRFLSSSTGNVVADNAFTRTDGGRAAQDDANGNRWNVTREYGVPNILGGPALGGNAWNDYLGRDFSNPSDGLGDEDLPFTLPGSGGGLDQHPLAPAERWFPDTLAPVTVLDLAGPLTPSGWYAGDVTGTLSATDDLSGVAASYYSITGAPFVAYATPFVVTGDGRHAIDYYSRDIGGNDESVRRAWVQIDATPPELSIDVLQVQGDDLCFALDVTDVASGVASASFTVNDDRGDVVTTTDGTRLENVPVAPNTEACAGVTIDGYYRLFANATDAAGNRAENMTRLLVVDVAPPILELVRPEAGDAYSGTNHVDSPHLPDLEPGGALVIVETQVFANATDVGSGVAYGELWVDGYRVARDEHPPFRWWVGRELGPGRHVLTVKAFDAAGHEAEESRTIYLVTDALDRVGTLEPEADGAAACVAFGSYLGLGHGTYLDVEETRVTALSRANFAFGQLHGENAAVTVPAGVAAGSRGVASTCDATGVPAHEACGLADATDATLDFAGRNLPVRVRVEAFATRACADPAVATANAVVGRVTVDVAGVTVTTEPGAEADTVIPVRVTDPLTLIDRTFAVLYLNSTRVTEDGDCRRAGGYAARLDIIDPDDDDAVAATGLIGYVATVACKHTPQGAASAQPSGTGVVPGTPAAAGVTLSGAPGQLAPTGSVTFVHCTPDAATRRGCAADDGAVLGAARTLMAGAASSDPLTDTWPLGKHCFGATYPGDAYYLAGTFTNGDAACFTTTRQPVAGTLAALPNRADVVPGTAATATAAFSGEPGAPVPTGDVTFFLCAAHHVTAEGCPAPFGTPAASAFVLDAAGHATSAGFADTWATVRYCFRAEYAGDAYYAPGAVTNADAACFSTVRQPATVVVSAVPGGSFDTGGTAQASATVSGGPGEPLATGTVVFHMCRPRDVTADGCATGGSRVDPVRALGSGSATSGTTTDTNHIGRHCFRVTYGGDAYYLPTTGTGATACFETVNPCVRAGARFGAGAAASGDHAVIGAPGFAGGGAACVFSATTGAFERFIASPGGSSFGATVTDAGGGTVLIGAPGGSGVAYHVDAASGSVLATLTNPTPSGGDDFGAALARHGGTFLVGAPGEDKGTTDAGVVHVFTTSGGHLQTLNKTEPAPHDRFGSAVAGAGDFVLVGVPNDDTWAANAGAAYLMTPDFSEIALMIPPPDAAIGDAFGAAVAVATNGDLLVAATGDDAGAVDAGIVHRLEPTGGTLLRSYLNPQPRPGDGFGAALRILGTDVLIGAPSGDAAGTDAGAAYVLHGASGAPLRAFTAPTPRAGDAFGSAVAVTATGIIAGAPNHDTPHANGGAAHFADDATSRASLATSGGTPSLAGAAGRAVATLDGDVLVGKPGAADGGVVTRVTAAGSLARTYTNPTPATGDRFGAAVLPLGGFIAIGAPGDDAGDTDAGVVHVVRSANGFVAFTLTSPAPHHDDAFGTALALDATRGRIIVGAPGDDTGAPSAGAVFVFDAATGGRVFALINPTPNFNDDFGTAVAVAGDYLLVGAPGDDAFATDGGVVHVFDAATGAHIKALEPPAASTNDLFGAALAALDGDVIVGAPGADVAATNAGAAYRFDIATGDVEATFTKPQAAFDDRFGAALVVAGTAVAIGAPGDDTALPGAGAVHVLDAATGRFLHTVLPSVPAAADGFGTALAVAGDDLIVGAPGSDVGALDAGQAFVMASGARTRPHESW